MKLIFKIFLLHILITTCLNAQSLTWQKYYPYNQTTGITDIIQTFDGGYILAGGISIPPGVKILLIKINYLGVKEWEKIISDSANYIQALSIKQTSDSGYVMTGQRDQDFYVLKTNSEGNFQWRKSFNIGNGDARPNDIIITNDNGFILCGGIFYVSNNSSKSYLVKTDFSGNLEWEKLFGDSIFTSEGAILKISNNEYFLVNADRRSSSSSYLGVIYKLNSNGDIVWKKGIGLNQVGAPILYLKNEGLFLAGQSAMNTLNLIKLDTAGNLLWYNNYNIPLGLQNVCINSNLDFIFGGYQDNNNQWDFAVVKIDINGNFIENKMIETPKSSDDFCSKVRYTNDRGYIFTGNTNYGRSSGFGNNILAVKTDSAFNTTPIVNIFSNSNLIPEEYVLYQNYPNPFNPSTTINYELSSNGLVRIIVYDISGREIKTLVNEFKTAGSHDIVFDGIDLASGVYFYRLEANEFVQTKRMVLIK